MPVITFSIIRPCFADYSINFDYILSFQYRQVDMQLNMFMYTYTYTFTYIYHYIVLPLNSFSRQGTHYALLIYIHYFWRRLIWTASFLRPMLCRTHYFYSCTSNFIFKYWDFSNKIFKSRNIDFKSKSDYFLECMNFYRFWIDKFVFNLFYLDK